MNLQNHLPGILFLKILLYLLSDLADHSLLFLFPDYQFQLDQAFLFLYDHFHLLYLAQFFLCLPAFLSLFVLHSVPFDQCYFLYLPVSLLLIPVPLFYPPVHLRLTQVCLLSHPVLFPYHFHNVLHPAVLLYPEFILFRHIFLAFLFFNVCMFWFSIFGVHCIILNIIGNSS